LAAAPGTACVDSGTATFGLLAPLSNVRYIVCWDTDMENEGVVTALGGDVRRMVIKAKTGDKCTQFFLSREDAPNNIEVFVLRRLIADRLGIDFK
jgi:hypothetical protein